MRDKYYNLIIGLAIIGLIIGSWGMFQRLFFGHLPMAYGSYVPWGLWVAFDLFFLGLTAGAFIITVLTYGYRIKWFASLGPISVFMVLVTLMCEGLIISMDLGHPLRIYRFLVTPNFKSMLTWLVIFILSMWAIYLTWFYLILKEYFIQWSQDKNRRGHKLYGWLARGKQTYTEADRERDRRLVRRLAIFSIPVGVLFFGLHGALFAVLLNRPLWNGAMTPLLFTVAALLSGGALISFLAYLFYPKEEILQPLGHIVLSLLVVFLFLEGMQFFVGYQSGITGVVTSLNLIAFGPFWWAFWIVHLLIGSVIPLFLLISRPRDVRAIAWACFLILLTFFAVRLNYLIPDLAVYKLEGLENTFFHKRLRTDYVPNLNEWLVSVWVISLGILTFFLGSRWLPVLPAGKGEEEHAC